MKPITTIDPDRLLSAADVLLKAVESDDGRRTLIDASVGGSYSLHSAVKGFTIPELVEAMSMLVRMGFVPPPAKRR